MWNAVLEIVENDIPVDKTEIFNDIMDIREKTVKCAPKEQEWHYMKDAFENRFFKELNIVLSINSEKRGKDFLDEIIRDLKSTQGLVSDNISKISKGYGGYLEKCLNENRIDDIFEYEWAPGDR